MIIDLLSMNSTTNVEDYNCAGFALGTLDWENMDSFDTSPDDVDIMLKDCAKEIQLLCPELMRISDYKDVPYYNQVIGFRVAFEKLVEEEGTDDEYTTIDCEDFHAILRAEGKWYHKPGSNDIREVDFNVDEPWPHIGSPYNSDILWFERA